MAIYHHHAQVIGRSGGRSAVASAAYRSGEKLEMVDGRVLDYSRRHGISHTEILAPEQAADWMKQRQSLWLEVEQLEKRKDAQLAREVQISLPRELDEAQQIEVTRDYVQEAFVSKGMIADIAIHDSGKENPHAHIMLTMREIEGASFGKKQRAWNGKAQLVEWRKEWAEVANTHLEKAGFSERIDHRSLLDQGITREPKNLSMSAYQMEHKQVQTLQGERQRAAERSLAFAAVLARPETQSMIAEAEQVQQIALRHQQVQQVQERSHSHELGR